MPVRLEPRADGTVIEARTPRGSLLLESRLPGRAAAYDVLAAAAAGVALDLPFAGIAAGVRALTVVPGRMQTVSSEDDDVTVIVDSAHTDDALRGLLETVRQFARRRIVTVFGCGGDRDATKRPLMGVVATRLSDAVILTSDNPRSEDPKAIIDDIERGLGRSDTPHLAIVERAAAIRRAVDDAGAGDIVVIAGKGHERYQVIGSRAVPFDDVVVARAALDARSGRQSGGMTDRWRSEERRGCGRGNWPSRPEGGWWPASRMSSWETSPSTAGVSVRATSSWRFGATGWTVTISSPRQSVEERRA